MKILIVGSGGREHAIAWKISQNQEVEKTDYEEGFLSNLGTRIKRTKDLVWDNVLETQKELNHQVCLSMYNQLQKVYQLPAFQIAFLVALYMLSF